MKLNDHVQRYLGLVNTADALFDQVRESHAQLMPCKPGCNDCCSVYFRVGLIEAFVINGYFRHDVDAHIQQMVLRRTAEVEPMFEQALKRSYPADRPEQNAVETSAEKVLGAVRIPCVLHADGSCLLYEHRPITCRLYGTPQKIGDQVIACPKTGFQKNHGYLAIDVTKINETLHGYSREFLVDLIGIDPRARRELLFPLPTALRLNFDKSFFMSLRERLETQ